MSSRLALLTVMAGCVKQVDGAPKFLRGIRALPGYCNFAEKQAGGIKKALEKLQEVTPGEAAAILDRIDDTLWTATQVEAFREALACKTHAVLEDESGAGFWVWIGLANVAYGLKLDSRNGKT